MAEQFSEEFLDLRRRYASFMLSYDLNAKAREASPMGHFYHEHYTKGYLRMMGVLPHTDRNGATIGATEIPAYVNEYRLHPQRARYEAYLAEKSDAQDIEFNRRRAA